MSALEELSKDIGRLRAIRTIYWFAYGDYEEACLRSRVPPPWWFKRIHGKVVPLVRIKQRAA